MQHYGVGHDRWHREFYLKLNRNDGKGTLKSDPRIQSVLAKRSYFSIRQPPDLARARTAVDLRVRGSMKPFLGGGGNTRNNSSKHRRAKCAEAVGDFSWPGTQWRARRSFASVVRRPSDF